MVAMAHNCHHHEYRRMTSDILRMFWTQYLTCDRQNDCLSEEPWHQLKFNSQIRLLNHVSNNFDSDYFLLSLLNN